MGESLQGRACLDFSLQKDVALFQYNFDHAETQQKLQSSQNAFLIFRFDQSRINI